MKGKRLAIIGSGDLGQIIAYQAISNSQMKLFGFFDDFQTVNSRTGLGVVRGSTEDVIKFYENGEFDYLMVGVGYNHFNFRKLIFEQFKPYIPYANVIHTSSYIDPSVSLGTGILIHPGCVLDQRVQIEDNVILNTSCCLAHDSTIGDHSFLSPSVSIAGFVSIGKACNLGINTTIIDNIKIADEIQTGGGTVVISNLQTKGLYVGNPARFVR